jgi:hypothetical protein
MEKEQRSKLQKATQEARRLLEEEFSRQLLETYDINVDKGRWSEEPGAHLQAEQRLLREKLLAWIEHRSVQINDEKEALLLALREMAFTALNRFVALKLMEARELVRPCVSGGLESEGFKEFTAVAQGLLVEQESSYRLYLETIFEDVSRELRALFDPRDPASLLWPKRTALLELLDILNRPELAELWREDETLGWVYQYFNGNDVKEMRDAAKGGAPRNSRELAVRNQFFTPRYVVEFLTDNTLGRIWYEIRQGDTDLKERCRYLVRRPNEIWLQPGEEAPAEVVADEALSQEELLRQPVYIPHRPLKDPREIRMLDPACGSMHFGLYAFDLYLAIYEEAWEIAQGFDEQAKRGEAFAAFVTYAAEIASKADFLREVPRLILQHNIHGVDIDPRATQIAKLTLWLRAQRAWQEQGVEVAARPAITRSNVVCAEPMPGERELLADFVDQQFPEAERGLVQQLLEVIFNKMQLAGEAGSLLKIEEEIGDAIGQARWEWQKLAVQQQDLFSAAELAALGQVGSSLNTDLQNLTKDFWVTIEERIFDALRNYANQAESGGYQRRLFAEDAAQGFAFIDVCRKRYDAALMNPPFGECSEPSRNYLQKRYPGTYKNLFSSFIERMLEQQYEQGLIGAVTSRTFLFLPDFEYLRDDCLFTGKRLLCCSELGEGVLDNATVRVAATVIRKAQSSQAIWFTRLTETELDGKSQRLLVEVKRLSLGAISATSFLSPPEMFQGLPGKVFAYTTPQYLLRLFSEYPSLQPNYGWARRVPGTGENEALLRLRLEVPASKLAPFGSWLSYAKGGSFSPLYGDCDLVISAVNSENLISTERIQGLSLSDKPRSEDLFGAPSLTFSYANDFGLDVRPLRAGSLFDSGGPIIFPCRYSNRWWLLGLLNSRIVRRLLFILTPERFKQVGLVQSLPISTENSEVLACEAKLAAIAKAEIQTYDETSPIFVRPLVFEPTGLRASIVSTIRAQLMSECALWSAFDRLDKAAFSAFGLSEQQRDCAIREVGCIPCEYQEEAKLALPGMSYLSQAGKEIGKGELTCSYMNSGYLERISHGLRRNASIVSKDEALISDLATAKSPEYANALLSWLVGVTIGRWSIEKLTCITSHLEPDGLFDMLPVCSPGHLQSATGLPACLEDVPTTYPACISWDGILVDDPNHPLDIERRVREVIKVIWNIKDGGPMAETIEREACEIIGVLSVRGYFRKPTGFFADHLKRYSKSRRQAPIYWQLSAGNGNYSAWLYYHRFTQDTLYRLLGDFVEIRIQEAEREQFEFESQGGLSGDAAGLLHEVQTLLQDLRLFKSELELVAPLWNPNLNDGVIINHAILWRIAPHTPWQKKCKECWDKLVKGDYDWAHLSFHLWPERVIRKCTTDRSLAIAHGLEERLWQETSKGNWLQRQVSDAELQALLAEYSKPAVQNALERFLAASPPVAAARSRAPRAAKSSSSGTTRRPRGSAPEVDAETSRQTLLVLTAAPADGLGRNAIAELLDVEAASLTAVLKQLKESGQLEQLGAARGAKYRLSESGLAAVESQDGVGD